MLVAPWKKWQVEALNRFQATGRIKPLRCRTENCHGLLLATTKGWVCADGCGYTDKAAAEILLQGVTFQTAEAIDHSFRIVSSKGVGWMLLEVDRLRAENMELFQENKKLRREVRKLTVKLGGLTPEDRQQRRSREGMRKLRAQRRREKQEAEYVRTSQPRPGGADEGEARE